MDIQRPNRTSRRWLRWGLYLAGAALVLAAVSFGLSRLRKAAPAVDRATVWVDTVQQGPMLRQVRGVGTLVPEEIVWIPAVTAGRVDRILVRPGTTVAADTVLLELSNAELEQTAVEAEMQLRAAEAELANLRVQLQSQLLNQRAAAASVQADYSQARLQADVNQELAREGLISDLQLKLSRVRAEELTTRHDLEQQRLAMNADAMRAQIETQQARIGQYQASYRIKRGQLDALHVRAGIAGVLQDVPVEVGQQVAPGANLARVADPARLKAEIKVPETQARDITLGQAAAVDTRHGVIAGRVARIDPAVRGGTVAVDIALTGDLPKGARPDLSVDGTIEIVRLDNAVFVGRPAFVQEGSTIGLFRLEPDGAGAVRVPVRFGRGSVNTIEVLEGLRPGDRVILSDMSAWSGADRVQLK
ncbi:MAG TPA: HlyD family efflux transporter periplasmic adaptor subunit [Acidobacteriota bacterium]|nr:HlyD family efflux transporter periplasmic adaptor subunit [Acidobacteriota bacterium]HQM64718.1 HlyD family efflux transporter periplasmic adaptor subunit [Acidobacteriota bacterium]